MLVTNSLTHSLTDSCFVNLIDVTLACEDANSKLVEVATVADVERVDNSLVQICLVKNQFFVQNLSTKFCLDFEVEAQA